MTEERERVKGKVEEWRKGGNEVGEKTSGRRNRKWRKERGVRGGCWERQRETRGGRRGG